MRRRSSIHHQANGLTNVPFKICMFFIKFKGSFLFMNSRIKCNREVSSHQDSKNISNNSTKQATKKWKNQARGTTTEVDKGKENIQPQNLKRKNEDVEIMIDEEPKVKLGRKEQPDDDTTVEAAWQPRQDP
ncbi:hypothetical protein PIB30_062727 [Stylosanthes scabra]|uniref:Uncharacterized protein n=1 Tax=Stylosanthes scabra TaxID=79078 RepID=A0ABU6WP00_9FABA|nr:hypothetical protein [Stylosanthes scabra]